MTENQYYEGDYVNFKGKGIIKEKDLKEISKLNLYKIIFTTELRVFAKDEKEAITIFRDFDNENGIIPEYEITQMRGKR